MESRKQVLTRRIEAPAANGKEKTALSCNLVQSWQNGRREAKPAPQNTYACALSLKSGNFHKKWLMQDLQLLHQMQKALVRLRLGFSQPAVYKERAQAALSTLLTRTPANTYLPTRRRAPLSPQPAAAYWKVTPYWEPPAHSEPSSGTQSHCAQLITPAEQGPAGSHCCLYSN